MPRILYYEKRLLKFLSEAFAEREALRPAILSDVRKCQKPNTQGFSFFIVVFYSATQCHFVPFNSCTFSCTPFFFTYFRVHRTL